MNRFSDLVTKAARDMRGYTPDPAADEFPQQPLIRLDSNENPFGPSPRALDAMRSAETRAHIYPDDDCGDLRRKLAALHDLPVEQVLITPGSTGMLALLCETLLMPGLNAVTSQRSFVIYSMLVKATGAQLIEAPMQGEIFNLDAILAAVNEHTRLVFIANPNNPTGTIVQAAAVDEFLHKLPAHIIVVIDEAYYEFAVHFAQKRNVRYSNSLEHVRRGAAVVVLRTFSKAHGLAGLRIGYGLGPPDLMSYCARMRPTFSVSSLAEGAALAALDDAAHISRTVENNAAQSEFLTKELSTLGYRVVPTWANFLYCDLARDAAEFARRLRSEGISVRPLGPWGAPNCIRVSIGTAEENEIFLAAVRKIDKSDLPR